MKIEIHSFPIVTENGVRWLDITAKVGESIEEKVLNVELPFAERWVERHNLNIIHDSEGEDIALTPRTYLFSDLFLNNFEVQKRLIRYTIESKL